jgi:hypothetical protein
MGLSDTNSLALWLSSQKIFKFIKPDLTHTLRYRKCPERKTILVALEVR